MLVFIRNKIRNKIYHKLKNFLREEAELERYMRFRALSIMDPTVKLLETSSIDNPTGKKELITIGKETVVGGHLFVIPHGGKIEIGDFCYISVECRIWSAEKIKIGNRVAISHNVNIHDTNSHSTNRSIRYMHIRSILEANKHPEENKFDIHSSPIHIDDDVWIGFNSTILKGVRIGKASIVAASSVVLKDVPPGVIVAGNPARIVKYL